MNRSFDMEISPSRLGNFILLRLAAVGNPPSRSVLKQALKPYFSVRLGLTDGPWQRLLDNTLAEMTGYGWIEERPFRLTLPGWTALRDFLQIDDLPAAGKWLALRNRYLIALALGIPPASPSQLNRLATADGVRAAVLARHYQLPIEPLPTVEHALDRIAEKVLPQGSEPAEANAQPLDRDEALRRALIPQQTGAIKVCLPAFVMKAQSHSVESLRQAVINGWLNGSDANECHLLNIDGMEADDSPVDLKVFARQILDLASRTRSGHFGGNKVFLSHLWNTYRQHPGTPDVTREEFDRFLLEANRQKLITLSRADFLSEMDPKDVEASEISLPPATFHFLRTDGNDTKEPRTQ
jgi:hypothetical protein